MGSQSKSNTINDVDGETNLCSPPHKKARKAGIPPNNDPQIIRNDIVPSLRYSLSLLHNAKGILDHIMVQELALFEPTKNFDAKHPKASDIEVCKLHSSICVHLGLKLGNPLDPAYLGFVLFLSNSVQSFLLEKKDVHAIWQHVLLQTNNNPAVISYCKCLYPKSCHLQKVLSNNNANLGHSFIVAQQMMAPVISSNCMYLRPLLDILPFVHAVMVLILVLCDPANL